jgi:hypothetical protein
MIRKLETNIMLQRNVHVDFMSNLPFVDAIQYETAFIMPVNDLFHTSFLTTI